MNVTINVPQFLQKETGGVKTAEVNGNTVRDCLKSLVLKYPGVKPLLFTPRGRLHKHLEVYINKKSAFPGELEKPVSDGDELDILNIILGG
jgi:molybdopterin converting factor small subunit